MTREETIMLLHDMKDTYEEIHENSDGELGYEQMTALDMAIEALKAEPIRCGEWIEKYNGNGWNDFWDYTCSNCGKKYERANAVLSHANFCPNCGVRMKGGTT